MNISQVVVLTAFCHSQIFLQLLPRFHAFFWLSIILVLYFMS